MIDLKQFVSGAILLCIGFSLGIATMALRQRVSPAAITIVPPAPTPLPAPTATPGPIQVFVNGEVAAPAVYALPADSIVDTAIAAAGGFTSRAKQDVVNLAQPLQDGMQIYVPAQDEETAVRMAVVIEPEPITLDERAETAAAGNGVININTADAAALDSLPGIGPSTAEKIIAYREAQGLFQAVEDVMLVSGIGEAKFEQIRDLITVEGP